ncbi:MAG: hypothetical protein QOF40_2821 [Actinomycetota bacterium]|nr:hypothetical protein [Actinomycetota bacterium]
MRASWVRSGRALLALVVAVALVGGASASTSGARAADLVDQLTVKGRGPKTGYAREQFGPAWADVDRNGCGTRNDILNRDLTAKQWRVGTHGCVVIAGLLADPYTGQLMPFAKADAAAVQIDHVVALSDAWQKGAAGWSTTRRLAFANDPLNLLAVDGPSNAQKSDGDTATWLPPNRPYRCTFVARQVAVKAKWDLWVTAAERDAMRRVLSKCPEQPAPA